MKRFELLIPPPLVMLLSALLMWLASEFFPALTIAWLHNVAAAVAIALLGIAVSLTGIATFKRARTTIDPKRPAESSSLVSSGIYRYSRNPMYLGVLLVLVGWMFYLGNLLSILGTFIFIAYITRFQIIPEERLLEEKFQAKFLSYKSNVRRWL